MSQVEEMNVCDNLGDHLVINEFEDGHWDNLATFQIRLGTFMWSSRRKRMPRRLSMTSTTGGLEEGGVCDWHMIQQKIQIDNCVDFDFQTRPVYAELTPVTDFREACCRQWVALVPSDQFLSHILWFSYHTLFNFHPSDSSVLSIYPVDLSIHPTHLFHHEVGLRLTLLHAGTRPGSAPGAASATSCTWSQSHASWDTTSTAGMMLAGGEQSDFLNFNLTCAPWFSGVVSTTAWTETAEVVAVVVAAAVVDGEGMDRWT